MGFSGRALGSSNEMLIMVFGNLDELSHTANFEHRCSLLVVLFAGF
jgi:hypothetical protein